MPISADQWRAVTGVNNVRRPRQVGIKPRYMQQEPCGDNEKLSHHPEPDANQDIARGGTGPGSKTEPQIKNSSSRSRKDQSGPMRDKVKDNSRSTWVDGDHDNFTSAMTSSVMGVQILVSVVVMLLLLLLSGDVETNPGPTGSAVLSMDKHLTHVKHAVWEAQTQWKEIGRTLGLPEGTIQSIHEPHDGECLHMVLSMWMQTGRATISDLLKALDDRTVARRDIARNIRALKGKDRINIGLEPDTDYPQPQGKKRQQQSGTSGPQEKKQKITLTDGTSSGSGSNSQLPYCATIPIPYEIDGQSSQKREMQHQQSTARAQMSKSKKWTSKYHVLYVYFVNPGDLAGVSLNTQNIIDWAKKWEHPNYQEIPKFKETTDENKAVIRVKFTVREGSRSAVGIDCLNIKTGPTMWLNLVTGRNDYNKHIVIHEFGHALGLEHEHQRSCFWSVASKFLDIEKMRRDHSLRGMDMDLDYLQSQTQEEAYETDYDPHSVMHYWFKLSWIRDPKYHMLSKIETDNLLEECDKKILRGIHTRLTPAVEPSNTDYSFLAKYYGGIDTNISPESTGPTPSSSHSAVQSQQSEPIVKIPLGNTKDTVQQAITAIEALANEMGRQDITENLGEIAEGMNSSSALKMGVIGTTNSGKTTTLNALLGKKLLPASFKPHTASLLCIKHDAELPEAVLYGSNPSINEPEKLDLEEDEICSFIEEEYIKQRSSSGSPPSFISFELHVPIPFLEGNKEVDLEIYDTPGTSEAGNNDITEMAEHAPEKLDGIILILAADSAYLKSSAALLQCLTDKYPLLMNRKEKRIRLLVNKYDVMYKDGRNPSLSDECQQLVERINVSAEDQPERINFAPEDIVFFSSQLGLQAKIFKNDPNSVNEDSFDEARASLLSLPEKARARPIRFSTDGSVKKLGEVLECSSRIGAVERLLKNSCIHYRSSILMRKAIDETQCQVTVLRDHAEQEIKKLSVQKIRYEMISQQLLEFPKEVKGEISTLLSIHVSTVINAIDSFLNTQLGILSGTKDSIDSVSQLIDIVRSSLIAASKLTLSDSFGRAINELQARLSILFGQRLDQFTEDLSKVEGGNTIETASEKFQQPTFDLDIEGHISIDTATLHSHIIESTETRQRLVSRSKRVGGFFGLGAERIHYTEAENYSVPVYKANINDLNAPSNSFLNTVETFFVRKSKQWSKNKCR